MLIRTEAIVLRNLDYRETSQIVTLFTKEHGKVAVIAKGSRRAKSPFGSSLQPMSHTEVVYYSRSGRELQTLSESAHLRRYPAITSELDKITLGLRMVELVHALMPSGEVQADVFLLLQAVFEKLEAAPDRWQNLWPFFQLRMAGVLGFYPAVTRDAVQEVVDSHGVLQLETGSVASLDQFEGRAERASRQALRAFAVLAKAEIEVVLRMALAPAEYAEVLRLTESYLRFHVEEAYPTRSARVIAQLKSGGQQ